jgi:hypothetical protein
MERTKHSTDNSEQEEDVQIIYDQDNEPLVIGSSLIHDLLQFENPLDLIGLYNFYYYTAKYQKTNQPRATDTFCQNGLKIGKERFFKAKKTLLELGLIEKIQPKNEKGFFNKTYLKVNFIWGKATMEAKFIRTPVYRRAVQPESGSAGERQNGNKCLKYNNRNASNINNKNTLNINNRNASFMCKNKITPELFDDFWCIYPRKTDKGKSKTKWNELCTQKSKEDICPTWEEITIAIEQQILSERWQDPHYIPIASTWIHQMRWLDDPEEMLIPRDLPKLNFKTAKIGGHKQYDRVINNNN